MGLFRFRNIAGLGTTALIVLVLTSGASRAGPVFDWVCDTANCNGDPGFSFTIEFADGVVAPNASFTGVAGNIVSATLTSGVGSGFTLTLDDLIEGGGAINDRSNFYVKFDGTGTQVEDLLDVSTGTNLTFAEAGIAPRADIYEGTNFGYTIGSLNDGSGFSNINITGRLVLRPIPEPATLAVFALGLSGLALARRKRRR